MSEPKVMSRDEQRDQLRALSRTELFEIEDALLLPTELDSRYRTRFSSGRTATFLLGVIYWGLLMAAMSGWQGWKVYGILTLIPFFGSFFIAIMLADRTWRRIGMRARFVVRMALHYWPVTIFVAFQFAIFFRA